MTCGIYRVHVHVSWPLNELRKPSHGNHTMHSLKPESNTKPVVKKKHFAKLKYKHKHETTSGFIFSAPLIENWDQQIKYRYWLFDLKVRQIVLSLMVSFHCPITSERKMSLLSLSSCRNVICTCKELPADWDLKVIFMNILKSVIVFIKLCVLYESESNWSASCAEEEHLGPRCYRPTCPLMWKVSFCFPVKFTSTCFILNLLCRILHMKCQKHFLKTPAIHSSFWRKGA